MFLNHIYKITILPTLVIRIPNLEIFIFCQHNSTGGGNLELRQTISNSKLHTEVGSVSFLSRAKIVYQGVAEVN
jgi:hypothetical protein